MMSTSSRNSKRRYRTFIQNSLFRSLIWGRQWKALIARASESLFFIGLGFRVWGFKTCVRNGDPSLSVIFSLLITIFPLYIVYVVYYCINLYNSTSIYFYNRCNSSLILIFPSRGQPAVRSQLFVCKLLLVPSAADPLLWKVYSWFDTTKMLNAIVNFWIKNVSFFDFSFVPSSALNSKP
jgi:hypothetical protein